MRRFSRGLLLALGILLSLLFLDHPRKFGIALFLQIHRPHATEDESTALVYDRVCMTDFDLQEMLKQLGLAHEVRESLHGIGKLPPREYKTVSQYSTVPGESTHLYLL